MKTRNEFVCEIKIDDEWEEKTSYFDRDPSSNFPLGMSASNEASRWVEWMVRNGHKRDSLRVRQVGWKKKV